MMDMDFHFGMILCKRLPALLNTHVFMDAGAIQGPSISTLEMQQVVVPVSGNTTGVEIVHASLCRSSSGLAPASKSILYKEI